MPIRRSTGAVPAPTARPRRRLTRLRVVLAAGLVLGVGASVTLAAWTDNEYASGTFSASRFDTVSKLATDPATAFASHPTSGAAVTFAAAADWSPTSEAFAGLDVRTSTDSTVGGAIRLTNASATGGLATGLTYRAVVIAAGTTCAAAVFTVGASYIAGGAGTTGYISVTAVPPAPAVTPLVAAGATAVRFCFDVLLPLGANNNLQGLDAAVTWEFTATSAS